MFHSYFNEYVFDDINTVSYTHLDVYKRQVVEEGEITIRVKTVGGSSRYDKIVTMIEESEKLKSSLEGKAEHLADKLVPYTLGGTALTYLLTRNATKALAILMVDFSCALKLAMPISVLSAIREAGTHKATVKMCIRDSLRTGAIFRDFRNR